MNDAPISATSATLEATSQAGASLSPLHGDVFLGGFECTCHRRNDGARLDLLSSTRHRELVDADYARLRALGMTACRDGVPWVDVERTAGVFDFSLAAPMLHAAERRRVSVIWDLLHFGWPDDVDVFSTEFAPRFAAFARAFARFARDQSDRPLFVTPINEISFLAWAGGDVRYMNPLETGRGAELKAQLVRATIAAIDAIREVRPGARFVQPEPLIRVHPVADEPKPLRRDGTVDWGQDEAWDMIAGACRPDLGGAPSYLDVVGVNYYPHNQFTSDAATVRVDDPRYRPLSELLLAVWERYRRPILVTETGAEGDGRASWLRYVAEQCAVAMTRGCDVRGITLYPVVNHPGWLDDRRCENGLWDYADERGDRPVHEPLREAIEAARPSLLAARRQMLRRHASTVLR